MAKVQFEYDLKSGQITDLSLHPGTYSDMRSAYQSLEYVSAGDLLIRDLAYISKDVMAQIAEKGAYFVNRLRTWSNVYVYKRGQWEKLSIAKIEKKIRSGELSYWQGKVSLDEKGKQQVWMLIEALPPQEKEKRIRKGKKNASKKKRQLSEEYKALAGVNIFITNVAPSVLPCCQLREVYRLRWQIELMFKIWKSTLGIHRVKKVSRHRLECYLWARLLLMVLGWELYHPLARFVYQHNNWLLSPQKFFTLLKSRLETFHCALVARNRKVVYDFIKRLARAVGHKEYAIEDRKGKTGINYSVKLFK